MSRLLCGLLCLLTLTAQAQTQTRPLLDIADVQGLRENQLVGYGLVVGLSGTGDRNQVKFTSQSMTNMLKQFGVQLPANIDPKLKNVAAVAVHANLSSVAGRGQTVDVTVSSIGDAKSLLGGSLLMTPLRGVDGEIYAVAQGNLVVGGVNASGNDGSSVTVNIPTVGLIPNGATIEREVPVAVHAKPQVVLNLKVPNFKTARNVELAINKVFGPKVAAAQNAGRVLVQAPVDNEQRVVFMSMLQDIRVDMGRQRPRVVFNSRTGTVVMGQDVKVHKAAVTHGSLTVTITEDYNVSQPNGGGFRSNNPGRTVVTPDSKVNVDQEHPAMFVWPDGTSLETIVQAVNSLGASPGDIMSILQALDEAGALEGDLVVI
ncbi:flagellar basal body P-ring protein FlgI [Gallaecimonas pentaromativorans]|uniref:flagellar basal body P-ring protein FlgI n=1 Tax=Gallaecimonas pentaromativorans TaxID=584787 RepID=UPI003A95CCF1